MSRPLEKTPQRTGLPPSDDTVPLGDATVRRASRLASSAFMRRLAGVLLGLVLIAMAPAALSAGGEGTGAGQAADLGYADVIAPLRAAAKDNDVRAQETLGFMYLCAESRCAPGIARDLDEARYWLSRAAAQGSMVAAYQLAWLRGEARPTLAAKQD